MSCKQWDVILVPFPFTDLSDVKKRPALVVSPDQYNDGLDLVIAFITSHLSVNPKPGDYQIHDWKLAGLPKPSLIRMKFATIHQSVVLKTLGKLSKSDTDKFRGSI